jgi:hypothetical protein
MASVAPCRRVHSLLGSFLILLLWRHISPAMALTAFTFLPEDTTYKLKAVRSNDEYGRSDGDS